MATKEGSVKALEKICELLGKQFDEKLLTWEALGSEEWDPNWVVTALQKHANHQFGYASRANTSTQFEDAAEREVDLEALRASRPHLAEFIEECTAIYDRILCHPKAKFLVPSMLNHANFLPLLIN